MAQRLRFPVRGAGVHVGRLLGGSSRQTRPNHRLATRGPVLCTAARSARLSRCRRVDDFGSERRRQVTFPRVWLAHEQQSIETEHAPEILSEKKPGWPGTEDHCRPHTPLGYFGSEAVTRAGRPGEGVHGMNDAGKRLSQRCLHGLELRINRNSVNGWDGDELSETA